MKTEKIRIYYNGQFIEVTHEVYTVLIKSDRKIKYFENDLKEEKIILDKKGTVVEIIPSREDSLIVKRYSPLQSSPSSVENVGAIQFADTSQEPKFQR